MLRFTLVTLLVLSLSTDPFAQRARSTRDGAAWDLPEFHPEFEGAALNAGARLAGDVDGDGNQDLLVLRQNHPFDNPSGMQVWLNDGRGRFLLGSVVPFTPYAIGPEFTLARHVQLADVTGDGVLDLAYDRADNPPPQPTLAPSGVLVHDGLGDGTFGPSRLIATDGIVDDFIAGDADGDGVAEILIHESHSSSNNVNTLAWWDFQGGGFVEGAELVVDAEPPYQLAAVDVDGDGRTDAVSGTTTGFDALQVFRSVNGAPTLAETFPLPSGFSGSAQRVRVGDLDGDGDDDVLFVSYTHNSYPEEDVFYVQPFENGGNGFSAGPLQAFPQAFADPYLSIEGVLADWDEDGDADYVAPFTWMENEGDGSLRLALRMPLHSGTSASRFLVADLDGDGHLDAFQGWVAYHGNGALPMRSSAPGRFENLAQSWRTLEDWDGDGDLDLVSPTYLYLNGGDGSFAGRTRVLPPLPGVIGPQEVGWGDFDGDSFEDMVVATFEYTGFSGMFLVTGREDGSYVLSATIPSSVPMPFEANWPNPTADLDGDGDLDIAARDGVWRNNGTGRFGSASVPAYIGRPLLARDVDGDGDVDLLVSRAGQLRLLTNEGGLSFADTALGSLANVDLPSVLDADEDGDLDVVVARPSTGVVRVHEQLFGGGFAPAIELDAPGLNGPVGQLDVDGDGQLDLAAGRVADLRPQAELQVLSTWRRSQGLTFQARRDWLSHSALILDPPRACGDLDGDGDIDAIGQYRVESFGLDGPERGTTVQYGLDGATPGTGGRHPLLGSRRPARPGSEVELAVRGGRGGASGFLVRGTARADVQVGGYRSFVADPSVVRTFVLDGTPGVAGAGSIALRTPVTFALVGRTFDYQVVLVDPGASAGVSATNGLEIRYGDWSTR